MKQPRFTAETLEKVIFPADEKTPAQYVYSTGAGQSVTLNAQPHELTAEEQGAALCFIIQHSRANSVKRGAGRRRKPAPDYSALAKNWTVSRAEIEKSIGKLDIEQIIDTGAITAAQEQKGTPSDKEKADAPGSTQNNIQSCQQRK